MGSFFISLGLLNHNLFINSFDDGHQKIPRDLTFSEMATINDYQYYKTITINHLKVNGSGALVDFPVLINLTDPDLHQHAQSNGADIAFYNGSTLLDYEIEYFNKRKLNDLSIKV